MSSISWIIYGSGSWLICRTSLDFFSGSLITKTVAFIVLRLCPCVRSVLACAVGDVASDWIHKVCEAISLIRGLLSYEAPLPSVEACRHGLLKWVSRCGLDQKQPSVVVSQNQLEKPEACSTLAGRPITNQSHVPSLRIVHVIVLLELSVIPNETNINHKFKQGYCTKLEKACGYQSLNINLINYVMSINELVKLITIKDMEMHAYIVYTTKKFGVRNIFILLIEVSDSHQGCIYWNKVE